MPGVPNNPAPLVRKLVSAECPNALRMRVGVDERRLCTYCSTFSQYRDFRGFSPGLEVIGLYGLYGVLIIEIELGDLPHGISPGTVSEVETKHGRRNFGSTATYLSLWSMVPLWGSDGAHLLLLYRVTSKCLFVVRQSGAW